MNAPATASATMETKMSMSKEQAEQFYGATAAEWLARWDAGDIVWSIEMGGLGPGYEQAIHITAAEILRHLLAERFDASTFWCRDNDAGKDAWQTVRGSCEKMSHANPVIKGMGLSGAQWGAAMNVAVNIFCQGPAGVMLDARVADRHIQVSKGFPK